MAKEQQNTSKTPLLDKINFPSDLKQFSLEEIKILSDELRYETINSVSKTGGHLGAGLGVVEITTAIHYVFDTPNDKLIWDVGHQAYPHKILTGRRDEMTTIRKGGGLSGFTKRKESEYDPFGAGHSSTSISATIGMAVASKINKRKSHNICVIGDGAMSAGMAYEAMNNIEVFRSKNGEDNGRLIVILNDNDMSIAPPVGAMSKYFSRLAASKPYLKIRDITKKVSNKFPEKFPKAISHFPKKFEKAAKDWWMGGNIFEEMGFYYIGPIDGHDLDNLIPILKNIRDDKSDVPILIHCVTEKGRGLNEKIISDDKLHAVKKFDLETGEQEKSSSQYPSYSKIFGKRLSILANKDKKITAITAAMPTGTGLDQFEHEDRLFDVGIAEQHAVTFSAGLACENLKPFVAIYSTFLQRAYDQIIHDVAIQQLPVRFAIDRAGFVGADGPTHAGSFDISFLINLPNFVLMAPSCGQELVKMVNTSLDINDKPSAFRFPRGEASEEINFEDDEILEIGKARIIQEGKDVAVVSYGTILENVIEAAQILKEQCNINITIIDARFAKPIDQELFFKIAKKNNLFITIEEGAIGGFGSVVNDFLEKKGLLDDGKCKFRSLFMDDKFIDHDDVKKMREKAGLGVDNLVEIIKSLQVPARN
ncbi:MAG: 1-deoxy-D-xylulose-5-phosphate synthase [Rickettsiales bacterium]|nr:1-deoxy-D-xylulose-5-phosphate synthase [Rickettsiales bacterium]